MNKGLQGQRGAVLLVVLVVSLLSSLLVFTSIQENQLQTRLSGNFHKKINQCAAQCRAGDEREL